MQFLPRLSNRVLFKYLTPHWASEMMRHGSILVGTLYGYRAQEANDPERGDAGEGTRVVHTDPGPRTYTRQDELPDFLRQSIRLSDGGQFVIGNELELEARYSAPDCYLYCLTERFDAKVMRRFGGACVRIDDSAEFFREVSLGIWNHAPHGIRLATEGTLDACVYVDRRQHHAQVTPAPEFLLKPVTYAHQREVRAVWQATSPVISPLPLLLPAVVKYCTRLF